MANNLKDLIRKRGSKKASFTVFQKYIKSIDTDDLSEKIAENIRVKLDKIRCTFIEFESIQEAIEINCDDEELECHYQERYDISANFDSLVDTAEAILSKSDSIHSVSSNTGSSKQRITSQTLAPSAPVLDPGSRNQAPTLQGSQVPQCTRNNCQSPSIQLSGIKLPTIDLPKFTGQTIKWLEFKVTYESLLHYNNSINDIQKFHYLRAALCGEPLKVIQSLEFTYDNYAIAWDLLCNRYNNSKSLVNSHVKSIFNLEPLTKENARGLRHLIDNTYEHLRALESLKEPVQHWDTLIIYIINSKLDKYTSTEWEKEKAQTDSPKLQQFMEFLKSRADLLEIIDGNLSINVKPFNSKRPTNTSIQKQSSFVTASTGIHKCNCCKQDHLIYSCKEFLDLSLPDRLKKVKELKLCMNCLRTGHKATGCRLGNCKKCPSKHNTLLHDQRASDSSQSLTFTIRNIIQNALLATAIVHVYDRRGRRHFVRVLLDSGSQSNFISKNLFSKLGLRKYETNVVVSGISNIIKNLSFSCDVEIHSKVNDVRFNLNCLIMDNITQQLPADNFGIKHWPIPTNIQLADPEFNTSKNIDILLGTNHFWDILQEGSISLGKNLPRLQNTTLGWIVAGKVGGFTSRSQCNLSTNEFLFDLRSFWESEECDAPLLQSTDDKECERQFQEGVIRNNEGRYVVRLPMKYPPAQLGDSRLVAINRLMRLEERFKRDRKFHSQYTQFIDDYRSSGHMTRIEGEPDRSRYYLPHHGVLKPESTTTKLRVVFDGSSPSSSGWSLNELQYTGAKVLNNLFDILIRFRQHTYVITADIKQMYRQILVHEDHRYLQNILWRDNPNEKLSTYQLNTVTYGTRSAPYLAIKCLHHLAELYKDNQPDCSQVILEDFYMDDLITGHDDSVQLKNIVKGVVDILSSAGFQLRKWASNNAGLLNEVCNSNDQNEVIHFDKIKTLGIQWICNSDVLTYHINSVNIPAKLTKRIMLSEIAKLFDPLGLLSGCIITTKILIQELWKLNINWDEEVPLNLRKTFVQFYRDLPQLNNLRIPRLILGRNPTVVQIHGFCDASLKAYGVVIYCRWVTRDTTSVNLICAKTRVAPIKSSTIPRLELCSALMLARLAKQISASLKIQHKIYLWSDSQVALHWIHTKSSLLQQYVSNRVAEIQSITEELDCNWNYVNTKENPADLASRGLMPKALLHSKLWWNGPTWLSNESIEIPEFSKGNFTELPEMKQGVIACLAVENWQFPFTRFSSFTKMKRTMGYCLRFINNSKLSQSTRQLGPLTVHELNQACNVLVKLTQQDSFPDLQAILRSESDGRHKYLPLSPFLDSDQIIRVGGRLKNSALTMEAKHPILVSGKHQFTRLLLEHYHKIHLHPGAQHLLSIIREQFWPTSGVTNCKKVIRNCITCFKSKPKAIHPIMAHLPKERVVVALPFETCGVDYAGPVILKDRKGRGCKFHKAYICLFICFSTKAVHLELVTDLTSDNFLACLRRFSSRRGRPRYIFSDNGTNFRGAANELKLLSKFLQDNYDSIQSACSNDEITWQFIPPNSPHFGGLWESNIKSAKSHLLRSIGETKLTYEEMLTILVQIEGTLNSRPLFPLSSDPNDLQPLTPSHFLLGRPLYSIPDPSLDDVKTNALSRYQLLQSIQQSFWQRWSKEYLPQLQQRIKWRGQSPSIQVGTMVLIKSDRLTNPRQWPLGRITAIHPGDDGIVRVVSVRTSKGVLRRSVTKVCPLPLPQNSETDN